MATRIRNKYTRQDALMLRALKTVTKESLWGVAINIQVLGQEARPNSETLRSFVRTLQSQLSDCPSVMLSILGPVAYDAVINFNHQ